MLRKRSNIIYAMQIMVQVVVSNIIQVGVSTGLPQSSFCESKEKVQDDRGSSTLLSIGKGKHVSRTFFVVFTAGYWDCFKASKPFEHFSDTVGA